jgi:peptidoglycan hydrolase-like protein with peptidoglycan-binding domain
VALLYGRMPAYRELRRGMRGADVRQLEANLARLGFTRRRMAVDEHYTAGTASAVRAWQRASGVRRTGSLGPGDVVFLPGRRRVGAHLTRLGALTAAGAEVLETSATRRVVRVALEAARQTLVERGDRVEVTLPDGRSIRGAVERVGRVARRERGGAQPLGSDGEPTVDLVVAVPAGRRIVRLDEALVTVAIERRSRRGVLAVPVAALLARAGGGFALELVGRERRLLPVRLGMAVDGYVEVSGPGLRAGSTVVSAQL